MFFEIDHLTLYRYSLPVQLGDHQLRFLPAERVGQRLGRCDLDIEPAPREFQEYIDPWGNRSRRLHFEGETDRLDIRVHLEVETSGPLTGTMPPEFRLPVAYAAGPEVLGAYLEALEDPAALRRFIEPLKAKASGSGTRFLQALNQAVHGLYRHSVRLDGPPMRPSQTLAAGEGVCRDLSVLFMAACRQVGLAARFVSGYQSGDGTREVRYLHAWPEVYIPGHGWVGFDPTHNNLVGADHVAVAVGPTAAAVTPVEGSYSFRGGELESTLQTEVRISTY